MDKLIHGDNLVESQLVLLDLILYSADDLVEASAEKDTMMIKWLTDKYFDKKHDENFDCPDLCIQQQNALLAILSYTVKPYEDPNCYKTNQQETPSYNIRFSFDGRILISDPNL